MVMRSIARPGGAVTRRYSGRGAVGPDPRHTRSNWPARSPIAGFGWLPGGVALCSGPGQVPHQALRCNAALQPIGWPGRGVRACRAGQALCPRPCCRFRAKHGSAAELVIAARPHLGDTRPRRSHQAAALPCTRPMRRSARSGANPARPERRLTVVDGEEHGLVMLTSMPTSSRLHMVGRSPRRLGRRVQTPTPFGSASAGEQETSPEAGKARPAEHTALHGKCQNSGRATMTV
jgi:hypothetical protein